MINKSTLHKELPDGWDIKPVPDCLEKASISRDIKIPQSEYLQNGKYPIIDQGVDFIAGFTDDDLKLYAGDSPVVVFGDHTRILKYVDFPFSLGADGTKLLRPKEFLDPKYFYFYLLQLPIESKGYNRHYKYLKEKGILFPEKMEQRKISLVLSKIQHAIAQQEKIIIKTKELKRSLMRQLFTRGLRGEELKETEIGLMPGSWEVKSVNDISNKLIGGGTPSTKTPEYWNGNIEWTTSKRLGERIYLYDGEKKISEHGLNNSSTNLIPKDNLLISTRVTVGKVVVNKVDIAISQDLTGMIINKDRFSSEFIAYQFKIARIQRIFNDQKRGATIKGIPREDLKEIKLAMPDLKEQKEIAHILLNVERKVQQAEIQKQVLQSFFKSMLQLLMTGQVRVKGVDLGEINV